MGRLRTIWSRARRRVIALLLCLLVAGSVAAEFLDPVTAYFDQHRPLGFALILGIVLVFWDELTALRDDSTIRTETPVALTPFDLCGAVRSAFQRDRIQFRVSSYSGETFSALVAPHLKSIAEGDLSPSAVSIQLLLPDCDEDMPIPCRTTDKSEDPRYKKEIAARNRRFIGLFETAIAEIRQARPAIEASLEVRLHRLSPLFKVILTGKTRAYWGIYPIAETEIGGPEETRVMWDYRGEHTALIGVTRNASHADDILLARLQSWFDTMWVHLSRRATES